MSLITASRRPRSSVVDPDHFDSEPLPNFHCDAFLDPDPTVRSSKTQLYLTGTYITAVGADIVFSYSNTVERI